MIKNDTIFGLVTLLFLQQIKYLGLGVRLARWGYKTRTGVFCILRRHCIGVWRHNNRIFSASTVFILHGRHGLAFPFIPKCLLSSRLWVMKSTREKEQHRKECFSQAGSLSVLFDRSHLGNIFGRWSGSRQTVFLRQLISLYGTEIWEITGSWSNFWCCPAAAMNGNEKGSPLPILFFVSSWDGLYICPLFVFLFMV